MAGAAVAAGLVLGREPLAAADEPVCFPRLEEAKARRDQNKLAAAADLARACVDVCTRMAGDKANAAKSATLREIAKDCAEIQQEIGKLSTIVLAVTGPDGQETGADRKSVV